MRQKHIDYISAKELYQAKREQGDIIKSTRKFGIELEMVPAPDILADVEKTEALHADTDKLVPKAYGVGTDGSLSSRQYGIEIQTPPMMLKSGEDSFRDFLKKLQKKPWIADTSCGVHVHLNAADIRASSELVRKIFLTYFVLDYSILAMLPAPRRTNVFCAPMDSTRAGNLKRFPDRYRHFEKGYSVDKIIQTKTSKKDFLEMFYKAPYADVPHEIREHYHEARYHGINFHTLYGNFSTIEIRYLEGTLDADTILNWTAFHQHIVDNARLVREVDALQLFHLRGPKTRLRKYAELTKMPQYILDWACDRIDGFRA